MPSRCISRVSRRYVLTVMCWTALAYSRSGHTSVFTNDMTHERVVNAAASTTGSRVTIRNANVGGMATSMVSIITTESGK